VLEAGTRFTGVEVMADSGRGDRGDRRPEMDRREVALELVKLGATTGFIPKSDDPKFVTLLKAYTEAFEAVIESERSPMLRR
jgi:hypothetical protein